MASDQIRRKVRYKTCLFQEEPSRFLILQSTMQGYIKYWSCFILLCFCSAATAAPPALDFAALDADLSEEVSREETVCRNWINSLNLVSLTTPSS